MRAGINSSQMRGWTLTFLSRWQWGEGKQCECLSLAKCWTARECRSSARVWGVENGVIKAVERCRELTKRTIEHNATRQRLKGEWEEHEVFQGEYWHYELEGELKRELTSRGLKWGSEYQDTWAFADRVEIAAQESNLGEFIDCLQTRGSFSSGAGVLERHYWELSDDRNNVPNDGAQEVRRRGEWSKWGRRRIWCVSRQQAYVETQEGT